MLFATRGTSRGIDPYINTGTSIKGNPILAIFRKSQSTSVAQLLSAKGQA
jgi:hypothetical protein